MGIRFHGYSDIMDFLGEIRVIETCDFLGKYRILGNVPSYTGCFRVRGIFDTPLIS